MAALVRGEWDAVRRVSTSLAKPLASEMCDLLDAYGRVLASDVRSLIDLPAADVSAMDGWAVSGEGPWQVRGRLVNGTRPDGPLGAQEAIGIGTGGVVPVGATAIVRREHGDILDGQLRWAPLAGVALSLKDVRPRGDEARRGDVMVQAGTRLDSMSIALAASTGHDELEVAIVPTIDLLVTGDEVDLSGLPVPGRVRDSVSPALTGMVRGAGGSVENVLAVPDDVDALAAQLRASTADIVVTTGGTAVGEADHLHEALLQVRAEIVVDRIAVRPGGPTVLAILPDGRLVAGLPGNPLAAVVGFLAVVEPALRAMTLETDRLSTYDLLGTDLDRFDGGTRIVPFIRTDAGAVPASWTGSSMLRGLASSDGLLVVRPGVWAADESVETLPAVWRRS